MAKSMNAEQKLKYMTETPLSKLILSLSVPTIISMLISSFYNMAAMDCASSVRPAPNARDMWLPEP